MPFALRRPPTRRSHTRRPLAVAVIAAGLLGLTATAASAHVTVKPDVAAPGGYAELVFRFPNESPSATTTKVVLTLPQVNPFTEVSVEPVPGWDVTVTDAPLPSPATVDGRTISKAPRVVTAAAAAAAGAAAIAPGPNRALPSRPVPCLPPGRSSCRSPRPTPTGRSWPGPIRRRRALPSPSTRHLTSR